MPVVELNLNRIKKLVSGNTTKKKIIDVILLRVTNGSVSYSQSLYLLVNCEGLAVSINK